MSLAQEVNAGCNERSVGSRNEKSLSRDNRERGREQRRLSPSSQQWWRGQSLRVLSGTWWMLGKWQGRAVSLLSRSRSELELGLVATIDYRPPES